MPKRPSSTPAKQRQQSAKRTRTHPGTGLEADDSSSNTEEDERPLLSTESENDLQKEMLSFAIFGQQPRKHEYRAIDYLASTISLPTPAPNAADYLAYLKATYPEAPAGGVVRAWREMKRYFEDAETGHSAIEGLVDVKSLVRAFAEASDITTSDWTTETAASSSVAPPQEPAPAAHPPPMTVPGAATSLFTRSAGAPSSQPPSDNNGSSGRSSGESSNEGSSESSSTELTPGQVLAMRRLFDQNFRDFEGESWSLSSGVVVDDRLHSVIKRFSYESALHSFVIEDVDTVLRLFEDVNDRDEIKSTLVTGRSGGLPALTPAEVAFLKQYDLPPADLDDFLSTRGWSSVGDALAEKPSVEFQVVAHDCITHVLRMYQQNMMTISYQPSEAWYNHQLWGFLSRALSCWPDLGYRSGNVTSEASAQRQREQPAWENRQTLGHEVGGLVVIPNRWLEICYVVVAKQDAGVNSIKGQHDIQKLMKLMKDGHDLIRKNAVQDIRSQLVTYSLHIAGPAVTIFSLHQCPGRFYQSVEEYSWSLPSIWTADGTTTVIATIARILRLRKALMIMAASVSTWTQASIDDESVGERDWMAATMTSPQLLPSEIVIPVGAMPTLDL
ncbi:hypothetical protein DFQ27_005998 [Actinomortierella ambigua]|uniref:Uncharacterized protein n=1 Tax=Actinomortierella ambigua TaxID=1343610 RepID=A0A9P6Q0F0_9FUNG|nr:hypothetical protein DFQ27_005998 [Actinomortierella ambigua]